VRKSYDDHLQDINLRAPGLFKPARILVLPDHEGMVALMHEYTDDVWFVFSVDAEGRPARSQIFESKGMSEVTWQELCDRLTQEARETLAKKLDTPGLLEGKPRYDAFDEFERLELADDDFVASLRARERRAGSGE
jgi:hypothetical protein